MEIQTLEVTIVVDDDFEAIDETQIEEMIRTTYKITSDTRKHTFYEIDSFGEFIDEEKRDLSLIYSQGIEFVCLDDYETLKNKIKKI